MTASLAMKCGSVQLPWQLPLPSPRLPRPEIRTVGDDMSFQYERVPLTTEPVSDTTNVLPLEHSVVFLHSVGITPVRNAVAPRPVQCSLILCTSNFLIEP